jgi:PTS system cellobiose-specific IIB component
MAGKEVGSMRILVVCGAGASSTFVAMRLRHAAAHSGIELSAHAGTTASLPVDLDQADILLIGPHLAPDLPMIRQQAQPRGVRVVVLPDDVFADLDGTRTLAQLMPELERAAPEPTTERSA